MARLFEALKPHGHITMNRTAILMSPLAFVLLLPSSGEPADITRSIDASQYFRPFPRLPAGRNTSIQKAPSPALASGTTNCSAATRRCFISTSGCTRIVASSCCSWPNSRAVPWRSSRVWSSCECCTPASRFGSVSSTNRPRASTPQKTTRPSSPDVKIRNPKSEIRNPNFPSRAFGFQIDSERLRCSSRVNRPGHA